MNLLKTYFNIKNFNLYLLIISANLLIMFTSQYTLINETAFFNTFSEQLSWERAKELFENLKDLSWIGYIFAPLILTLKFIIISVVIYSGIFLCDLQNKISFKNIFGIVIASEIIYLFAGIIKLLWFIFFVPIYDLNDLQFFFPLSLSCLFSWSEVDKFWTPALQNLNLFQIGYILLLSTGIFLKSDIPKNYAEKAVMISYIPGLVFWIALLMFLSVQLPT